MITDLVEVKALLVVHGYAITMVHGTFSPNADWCNEQSPLSQKLRAVLGESTVIEPFRWSGANSHDGRIQAAEELVRHLEGVLSKYPNHRHFVVGHSHAGNIMLYALRNPAIAKKITGIASLATPFFKAYPRDVNTALKLARFVFTVYATAMPVTFAISAFEKVDRVQGLVGRADFAVFVCFYIFIAAIAIVSSCYTFRYFSPYGPLHHKLKLKQKEIIEELTHAASQPVPYSTLCLTIKGDEALGWLEDMADTAEFPNEIWSWKGAVLCVTGGGLLSAALLYGLEPAVTFLDLISKAEILLLSFFVPAMFAVTFQVGMALWSKLWKGNKISYGSTSIWTNWLVNFNVTENCPINGAEEKKVLPTGKNWAHCEIHSNPEAVEKLVYWIRETAVKAGIAVRYSAGPDTTSTSYQDDVNIIVPASPVYPESAATPP